MKKQDKDMSYHELRKTNPVSARMLVRKILARNNGNVSKTAKILGIDRKTVRRARDGTLEDLSRRPKNIKNKTEKELEDLIVSEAKETGFGYKRLTKYLLAKHGIEFSQDTVRAILKRNKAGRKK
jgi:transposase